MPDMVIIINIRVSIESFLMDYVFRLNVWENQWLFQSNLIIACFFNCLTKPVRINTQVHLRNSKVEF